MNPVEFDGCPLLIVDGALGVSTTKILARGIGEYDGESFRLTDENGVTFELSPFLGSVIPVPLTGKWK